MSQFVGSIGLIRHPERGEASWLAVWNNLEQCYDFVRAERLEGESYRECLDRELAWTLRLRRGKDYIISSAARLHWNAPLTLPNDTEATYFVVEFYIVDLFGPSSLNAIDENEQCVWVTRRQLFAGTAPDGREIHSGLRSLIARSEVIANHEP